MNFKDCVLRCLDDASVIETFNRLHHTTLRVDLLQALQRSPSDAHLLMRLDEFERTQLACFIGFVHLHIWCKVRLMQERAPSSLFPQGACTTATRYEAASLVELMRQASGP